MQEYGPLVTCLDQEVALNQSRPYEVRDQEREYPHRHSLSNKKDL